MTPVFGERFIGPQPGRARLRARAGVLLGLLFLAGPLSDLFAHSYSAAHRAMLLTGLALFVAIYVSLLPPAAWLVRLGPNAVPAALALLPLIAVLLLIGGAPTSFVALLVYVAAAAGILLPNRSGAAVIGTLVLGVLVVGLARSDNGGAVAATTLTVLAIGAMMMSFGRLARANRELERTREELARLAVADERLRFARDLHDLLGHSLSVIALKSELAGRLVEPDPARAASELQDIQSVTREALAEVRDAVRGYRRLELGEAISGARAALAAAGIELQLADTHPQLPVEVDNVLAWAVREGTTNVIRHSDARSCLIRIHADNGSAALEIEDDGSAPSATAEDGSGLLGLRERAERVGGTVEVGTRPGGGFRLALTVPLVRP
jgi:two-component system, NarL family, sensor histidine kinase DesK